ncbi:MAG: deoxyribodipyrimidine photo-lyase [candidate division Zixibacteria bacterium]|nr:deoxyribodipyrimidine photo-lyase [candidate division Zixibacteria bacterium]
MIHDARIHELNSRLIRPGDFVVYWMQASQRAEYNHALEYAIGEANRLDSPLIVFFGLTDNYPGANLRHYTFMIEGLRETERSLAKKGIKLFIAPGSPPACLLTFARNARMIITDRGYTRVQRQWRLEVAERSECRVVEIESDVIVPVTTAYPKEAWSAAVLRRRIEPLLQEFLQPVRQARLRRRSLDLSFSMPGTISLDSALDGLKIDRSVPPVPRTRGGYSQARRILNRFIEKKLKQYAARKNDPTTDTTSGLSPYLHFGQISPLEIALEVKRAAPRGAGEFLEELIVRRELSMNFVSYNTSYDSFGSLPAWAKQTLHRHAGDKRDYLYPRDRFEQAATHDRAWNAAQTELLVTGRMHGYMRMYWGKKILEWSASPEEAFATAVYLNDKYQLDGRDPNGYAGVAWCFGKHDRPWVERPVFGMVRYMNEAGLRRKFDLEAYIRAVGSPTE